MYFRLHDLENEELLYLLTGFLFEHITLSDVIGGD